MGLCIMLNTRYASQRGFTLVELMVGVVVGLFVVLAASTIYLNSTSASRDSVYANRLNQDMRTIMDIMVADIRRAGYWASAATGNDAANPFTVRTSGAETDVFVSTTPSCILYTYDLNGDSAPAGEVFGFRLNGTTLETAPATLTSTAASNCALNSGVNWVPMNNSSEIAVTGLTFSASGSQCLVFNPDTYSVGNTDTWKSWAVTTATLPACDSVAEGVAVPGGITLPTGSLRRVEMRQVTITLTAQHARDSSLTRTLQEKVLVRNNRVI